MLKTITQDDIDNLKELLIEVGSTTTTGEHIARLEKYLKSSDDFKKKVEKVLETQGKINPDFVKNAYKKLEQQLINEIHDIRIFTGDSEPMSLDQIKAMFNLK